MYTVEEFDYIFKIKVIGNNRSGKSNLILRFANDTFIDSQISSSRLNYAIKKLHIDDKLVRMSICDSEGENNERDPQKLIDIQAFIVTVDMTNKSSFQKLQKNIDYVKSFANKNVITIVAATKFGDEKMEVSPSELIELCKQLDIPVAAVNAKTGYNIHSLFENCAKLLIDSKNSKNQLRTEVLKELLSSFKLNQLLCLAFLQGQDQELSPVNQLPKEIIHNIFSLVSTCENKQSFATLIFAQMLQIRTMRYINAYNDSWGFKSDESKLFIKNLDSLCKQKPDIQTQDLIKKSITDFTDKKIKAKQTNSKAMTMLIQHSFYKQDETNQTYRDNIPETCNIC